MKLYNCNTSTLHHYIATLLKYFTTATVQHFNIMELLCITFSLQQSNSQRCISLYKSALLKHYITSHNCFNQLPPLQLLGDQLELEVDPRSKSCEVRSQYSII